VRTCGMFGDGEVGAEFMGIERFLLSADRIILESSLLS
jgi:hypothetical protein